MLFIITTVWQQVDENNRVISLLLLLPRVLVSISQLMHSIDMRNATRFNYKTWNVCPFQKSGGAVGDAVIHQQSTVLYGRQETRRP